MTITSVPSADRELLSMALDSARLSLMLESKIPVMEVPEPIKTTIFTQITPLLERLKSVPGESQRRTLLSRAMLPILERSLPHPAATK